MKSSQDNVSSDETTTKTQQKLQKTAKNSQKQDPQKAVIESETPSTEHKKTPSDSFEEVVDDDNELSSEGAQSQVV